MYSILRCICNLIAVETFLLTTALPNCVFIPAWTWDLRFLWIRKMGSVPLYVHANTKPNVGVNEL